MRADYISAVLDVAALIPPAHVLSYGDIAVLLESGGPRQVGTVFSRHGDGAPWWRVIRASGQPPACHEHQALEYYRAEGTPLRGRTTGEGSSWRVDMSVARWNPDPEAMDSLDRIRVELAEASVSDPCAVLEA
ncbi:MAG TPA: MGMT family protein [Micrococcaceae bacterium]|jgi:alkylated DNA nucleotide flippase Atl1